MGMITVATAVENVLDPDKRIEFTALVDTGATYLTLPTAWRERLGEFKKHKTIQIDLADQRSREGVLCGPAKIEIAGFEEVYSEILFIDMAPDNGEYEPLLGCIPLETARMAVDLDSHTLVSLKRAKLK
jgi:predicted aspartyl protease